MMALEEKFDLQMDEEGEQGGRCDAAESVLLSVFPHVSGSKLRCIALHSSGAEKISTVQEAADMIAKQIASK